MMDKCERFFFSKERQIYGYIFVDHNLEKDLDGVRVATV